MTSNIDKKLREAQFFVGEMRDRERRAFGDKEPFEFCLSAFLNAARTVDYRLRHEQPAYPAWRKMWNAAHRREDDLLQFVSEDRRVEVHESGSARIVKSKEIKIGPGGSYSDASGRIEVFGPPATVAGGNTGATIQVPQYVFIVDGTERPVTEVCNECLKVLEQIVAEFKAHLGP